MANNVFVNKAVKAKYFLVFMYFSLSKYNCAALDLDKRNFLPAGWIVISKQKPKLYTVVVL